MTKRKKSKRKLNKKRILLFLCFSIILAFFSYKIINMNIKNIYISNNSFLKDQEIIDIALLNNYPRSIENMSYSIKKRLEKNKFILEATVEKKDFFSSVYIKVKENYPLFYYQVEDKIVLYNGKKIDDRYSVPTVINQIPNTVYDSFLKKMQKIDKPILERISEIQYAPNEVDQERFFLLMNDGNYVYININKFLTLNKYFDMLKSFDNKKGILYLDSGEYFDIFNE